MQLFVIIISLMYQYLKNILKSLKSTAKVLERYYHLIQVWLKCRLEAFNGTKINFIGIFQNNGF